MVNMYKNNDTVIVTDKHGDKYNVRIRANIPYNHEKPFILTEEETNTVLRAFKILDDKRFPEQAK